MILGLGDDSTDIPTLDEIDIPSTPISIWPAVIIVAILLYTEFGTKSSKRDARHKRMRKHLAAKSLD